MPYTLTINQGSAVPKYRQIVNAIKRGIEQRAIEMHEQLPSINQLSSQYEISRDTAEKAYRQLKRQGIILSVPGKGYFANVSALHRERKVLLVFNKLSAYKKSIFDGFVRGMQDSADIDFQVYHESYELFEKIIRERAERYTDVVVIPGFKGSEELRAAQLLQECVPADRLWLLNRSLDQMRGDYGAVFQNYENDLHAALGQAHDLIRKYQRAKLIFPSYSNYSRGIIRGFQKYCLEHQLPSEIIFKDFENATLERDTFYLVILDNDLVSLVKKIKENGWTPRREVGILAYNDSPLKEVLLDGITVVSTEHEAMGKRLADLVRDNRKYRVENEFRLIVRGSL